MAKRGLEANQLGFKRHDAWLWQDVHFALQPGELLQVVGENGAGKTTLLRIIAGLSQPTAGNLLWEGNSIDHQDSVYKDHLHYLGHQTAVKMELTVFENLKFNIHKTFTTAEITQVIERVGLTEAKNIQGFALSQGQKQRLALARVLLHDMPLWILDEPFSGLDEKMAYEMQKIFSEKLKNDGMIILTTHRSLTFSSLKGRLLYLESVPTRDLLKSGSPSKVDLTS